MKEKERALIQQAGLGNKNALGMLYQMHKVAIHTYIFYRVNGNSPLADDLTAELFGRMITKIHTYKDNGKPFLAWLYTIARNLITDHYRQEKRLNERGTLYEVPSRHQDPEQSAQISMETQALLFALGKITSEQQEVIILRFIEGRSVAETAEIMGKRVGAVKTMSRRALASLHRIMQKEGYEHV